MPSAEKETLRVPADIREAVLARDNGQCRVCGRHLGDTPALHHVRYGGDEVGMGGRRQHYIANLITICWLPWQGRCHEMLHGNKRLWLPYAIRATETPGVTILQLRRWDLRAASRR